MNKLKKREVMKSFRWSGHGLLYKQYISAAYLTSETLEQVNSNTVNSRGLDFQIGEQLWSNLRYYLSAVDLTEIK